jgi:hypothetical protein
MPTARSGHGAVWYRDRLFIMGGEGSNRVYGQNEAYESDADRWEAHAPMLTPRHGMGAVVLGDWPSTSPAAGRRWAAASRAPSTRLSRSPEATSAHSQ